MAAPTRGSSLTVALFVLVIAVSVNLLAGRFFARVDLTERKEYTISPSTRTVLHRLDDVVNIQVYFSEALPPYLATLDRQVKDLLDEYRARAGNKLVVEFIDPAEDPARERSVIAMGIPKVQLNIIQRDKAEVTGAFLGIAVQYEDKSEVIPVVQSVNNLEYDLTSAIVKVTSERETVGFAGSAEATLTSGLSGMQQVLGEQYDIRPVSPGSGPVDPDIATLIVVDQDGLTEEALYHIDQFVMRGGRLLVLAPGVALQEGTLAARDRQVRMGPLLATWGVSVSNALVADSQSAMASFSQGYMTFSVPYPWWPQIIGAGLSRDNPITATMDALVLPWSSPVAAAPPDTSGAIEFDVLARTSEQSFAKTAPYDLNPQSRMRPPAAGLEPQPMAVALRGRFPSHWADGKPVPGDSLGAAEPILSSAETQIVVVGSWQFMSDQFLGQFPSNSVFLANAVDWMTLGEELIAIRSRGAESRPLREVEAGERNLLKLLAILGVPVLVIAGGLVRTRVGQIRRRRLAREYGGAA